MQNKKDKQLLAEIVEATDAGSFKYTTAKQREKLLELGLVETNPEMVDPKNKNKIATRATSKGFAALSIAEDAESAEDAETETPEGTEEVTETKTNEFELETGIAVPAVKRGRGAGKYPFDAMPAPSADDDGNAIFASFHVAPTEKRPNPAKSLASTVSSVIRRYKDENGVVTRKFLVRRVDETDPKGEGARVFRVQ